LALARVVFAALLALAAGPGAAGDRMEEIRQALRKHLLTPPAESALAALDSGNLDRGLRLIDPHARFYTAQQYARERAQGQGVGIGASVARWGGDTVLFPYQDGPMTTAGVTEPAILLRIAGIAVQDLDLESLGRRLQAGGDTVALDLAPAPHGAPVSYHIRRGPYRVSSVELVEHDGMPIVRVRGFEPRETRPHLRAVLSSIQSAPLLLDLRDCPGGDLFEALDSAALFLPPGTLLGYTVGRDGERRPQRAPAEPSYPGGPLVLWVGPGTASAAEVFAGILHYYGLARLVGQATYGKCSSQTDITLSEDSVLRLTNLAILLPDGADCSSRGLAPDIPAPGAALLDTTQLLELSRSAARLPPLRPGTPHPAVE
jgi:carboxyl-terminal processing protease